MNKKIVVISIIGVFLFGVLYVSYPKHSANILGLGLSAILICIGLFLNNRKIRKEVRQYARENITRYNDTEDRRIGESASGDNTGNIPADNEGEYRDEAVVSSEGRSNIQNESIEVPELDDDKLSGVEGSSSSDSDTTEEYSYPIPDLE